MINERLARMRRSLTQRATRATKKRVTPDTLEVLKEYERSISRRGLLRGRIHNRMKTGTDQGELPVAFQRVIVVSCLFKCLGYIDVGEIWHCDADDKEIHNVIAWEEDS